MKLVGSLSMLAFVVAIAVVMTGSVGQAEKMLAPAGSTSSSGQEAKKPPVARAQGVAATVNTAVLYREAQLAARSAEGPLSQPGLVKELRQNEPGSKVNEPLRKGGTSVRVIAGDVEFCQLSNPVTYVCALGPLAVGAQLVRGQGKTLEAARGRAAANDPDAKRQSEPGAGAENSGGGQNYIDRAKQVPGGGS